MTFWIALSLLQSRLPLGAKLNLAACADGLRRALKSRGAATVIASSTPTNVRANLDLRKRFIHSSSVTVETYHTVNKLTKVTNQRSSTNARKQPITILQHIHLDPCITGGYEM